MKIIHFVLLILIYIHISDQQTGRIEFFTSDTTQPGVHAYILGATSDGNGNGDLRFGTGTAGSAVEKLRITSDGKLLLGHTASRDVFKETRVQISGSNGDDAGLSIYSTKVE